MSKRERLRLLGIQRKSQTQRNRPRLRRQRPFATPRRAYKDANGDLIKPDGWEIPQIPPKETRGSTDTGKTKKGRAVTYNVLYIIPENRPPAAVLFPAGEGLEWRIRGVEELSGQDGKIFCYRYYASPYPINSNANGMAQSTGYHLCDRDGDGKFEFYRYEDARKLVIPDWVK